MLLQKTIFQAVSWQLIKGLIRFRLRTFQDQRIGLYILFFWFMLLIIILQYLGKYSETILALILEDMVAVQKTGSLSYYSLNFNLGNFFTISAVCTNTLIIEAAD